uniref:VWFA domain-containing protein n=1 Tax=Panagrellus redivivus TaxID=6233 RepID=A0A7E4V528_PANRE
MWSKKLLGAFLIVISAIHVNGDIHGKACARNAKSAWLDLVIVLELTPATAGQNNVLMGGLLLDLYLFNISSTGDHTTRVALVTYNSTATVAHVFTDPQNLEAILSSYQAAVDASQDFTGETVNIAAGLEKAYDVIQQSGSNRIPGVVLFAATYDSNGMNNPVEAASKLKKARISLATVTFETANGVNNPDIAKLASDGLALDSKTANPTDFANVITSLNCVCSPGWTRLIINSSSEHFYSDCFLAFDTHTLPAFVDCGTGAGLVTVNTPERLEFITDTIIPKLKNPKFFSIGLTRTNASASWQWFTSDNSNLQWTTFPLFSSSPLPTDVVGYMHNDYGFHWELKSDDSYTNSRPYICQKAACDTNNICDRGTH